MPQDTLQRLRAGQLAGVRELKLSCGLTQFPPEIFDLADTLEILDLTGNALRELPPDLHRLHRLRVLFCSGNRFTRLPPSIGRCPLLSMVGFRGNQITEASDTSLPPNLRWLILTDNRLEELPPGIGYRPRLQKLMLAGNRLQHLPEELAQCRQLELLRVSANRLDTLPAWLLAMPRLSWLAYAGNPMTEAAETQAIAHTQAATLAWSNLDIGAALGEGASGVILEATLRGQEGDIAVAVKRFKGQITSDGLPRSELAACLAAGSHPHLIGALGLLEGDPSGAQGLVMRRIDASYQPLAGPPSFESCTRDVYDPSQRFTLATALKLALGVADAGAHLHSRGIVHGDLYAHNTLWNDQGQCLLGDFGAACFLPLDQPEVAEAVMRIEVRALGCLLQELSSRAYIGNPAQSQVLQALSALQERCLALEVMSRPSMAQVQAELLQWQQASEGDRR